MGPWFQPRADATLRHLRQALATIEKDKGFSEDPGVLALGLPALDAALGRRAGPGGPA